MAVRMALPRVAQAVTPGTPLCACCNRPAAQSAILSRAVKELTAALEVPLDPSLIEWRVTITTKAGKPRGLVVPYADQRAYTTAQRVVQPAGWTRKYVVHTSTNFERSQDQKTVAKVFVTCELMVFG